MSNQNVQIFRCTKCGRWSHAQRRPKVHQRTTNDESVIPSGARILSREWDFAGHEDSTEWISYECGPFEAYIARPEQR